jgi:peptide/nickel transport system ATP-binding protein
MYLGKTVEQGEVHDIFHAPRHPYTRALLQSIPRPDATPRSRLAQIEGMVPSPFQRPEGCPFEPRCPVAIAEPCATSCPTLLPAGSGSARCYQYDPRYAALWSREPVAETAR